MARKHNATMGHSETASIRRAVRYALAGLATLAMVPPVLAGPDACTVTATSRTCEGNQSNGVAYTTWPNLLYAWNLTADITPLSGNAGVKLTLNGVA